MDSKLKSREEKLQRIIETEKLLNEIQDVDVLLERLLTEARGIVRADAGSIYVRDGDMLKISYAQNDTQQKTLAPGQKMIYSFFSFPITERSIAGYCAVSGSIVNEKDVYEISADKPYTSNRQSDVVTGYRTKSNLTVPLKTASGKILGVLQMLNAQDAQGNVVPFTTDDELYVTHFASGATQALEHAYLTRSMILRMIKMAEFRDPKETGAHVNRVASYAIELYDHYAFLKDIPSYQSHKYRDMLKIAAMLHDVGKVAISDLILKKPGKLTGDEYTVMQGHTWIGARLFDETESPLDTMARDIALTHHENWDGTGYPGMFDYKTGGLPCSSGKPPGLKGAGIPLSGRIVAIADVFDALSSRRIYKDSWVEEDVLNEIRYQSGKKFDPELVDVFFQVLPNIRQIKNLYPDKES